MLLIYVSLRHILRLVPPGEGGIVGSIGLESKELLRMVLLRMGSGMRIDL